MAPLGLRILQTVLGVCMLGGFVAIVLPIPTPHRIPVPYNAHQEILDSITSLTTMLQKHIERTEQFIAKVENGEIQLLSTPRYGSPGDLIVYPGPQFDDLIPRMYYPENLIYILASGSIPVR